MSQFGDEDLNSILLGSIPKYEDLCYIMGKINLLENTVANVSNKAYQSQIFKCRCLIFSVPEVIASPVLGAVQNIHIIVSKKYFSSGKLQPHLDRINIKVDEPLPLTNAVYEACLRYTILARLAPAWNQVEKYLVQGRNFLETSAPLDAVKLDVSVNETDMHIVLLPLRLRLPQVCAQDFLIPSFNSSLSWDLSSNNLSVHVLPSLNRANILTVSRHIPQNSLFKNYKELKRHWKNSYGYRLPESEEGMIYLTVKFGRWFCESLTYPMVCVRSKRPVFLRQRETQRVLMELLADLYSKIPYICGFPFGVDATIRYAIPKLSTFSPSLFFSNLTETRPEPKKHANSREIEPQEVDELSQPVSQYTQTQTRSSFQPDDKARSISPPPFLPHVSQKITPTSAPCKPTFTPVFNPKPKPLLNTKALLENKPIFVPVFSAKKKPMYKCSNSPAIINSPLATVTSSSSSLSMTAAPDAVPDQPMFRGLPMKPVFGLAKPPPSQPYQTNTMKPLQNIKPKPLFNPKSSSPFNIAEVEKTPLHLPSPSKKKIRNKPQVQQNIDVKALAQRPDGLAKVNTTTLIAYLRSEGVYCKVKDKKGDLVAKVLNHLNLPTSTQPPSSQEKVSPFSFYGSSQ